MMPITHMSLPRAPRATIIQPRVKHVTFLTLCLLALCWTSQSALAQQQTDSKPESKPGQDDLDVTMQIIVDPDAKLPDEVVRRIPLPERKSVTSPATDKKASQDAAAESKQSAREAKELAKEASQAAKEEAAEQREQARRARAEERERERERNPPPGNPNPPGRPPH